MSIYENAELLVYATSKSYDILKIKGTFEKTGLERLGRYQLREINTDTKYWIPVKDLDRLDDLIERKKQQKEEQILQEEAKKQTESVQKEVKPVSPVYYYYTVKRGDTLGSIAVKFNTTPGALIAINGTSKFALGSRIRIK